MTGLRSYPTQCWIGKNGRVHGIGKEELVRFDSMFDFQFKRSELDEYQFHFQFLDVSSRLRQSSHDSGPHKTVLLIECLGRMIEHANG